jgi:hypothetical protein
MKNLTKLFLLFAILLSCTLTSQGQSFKFSVQFNDPNPPPGTITYDIGIRAYIFDGTQIPASGSLPYYVTTVSSPGIYGPMTSGVGASLPVYSPQPANYCKLKVFVLRLVNGAPQVPAVYFYGESGWCSYDPTLIGAGQISAR